MKNTTPSQIELAMLCLKNREGHEVAFACLDTEKRIVAKWMLAVYVQDLKASRDMAVTPRRQVKTTEYQAPAAYLRHLYMVDDMVSARMVSNRTSEYLGYGQFETHCRFCWPFLILKGEHMRQERGRTKRQASVQRLATAHTSLRRTNRRHTKR